MDYETASANWRYDPKTGLVFWLKPRPKVPPSLVAGTLNNENRVIIGLKGKRYYAHRIAWVLMTKKPAPKMVDHWDHVTSNNRWSNLRAASNTLNQGNVLKKPIGVIKRPYNRFEASIRINGKKKYLGSFTTARSAHDVYVKAHREIHGEFSCFAGAT